MLNYDMYDLIIPSYCIFLIGIIVFYKIFNNIFWSFFISFFKTFIFYCYFAFFFDATWVMQDSLFYYKEMIELTDTFTFIELVLNPMNLVTNLGSLHFGYQLFSIIASEFFGKFYFSPIALGIIFTLFESYFLYIIFSNILNNKKKLIYFIAFFSLHWDLLLFSTIPLLKGTLVGFFTVIVFYYIQKYYLKKIKILDFFPLIFILIYLLFTRYYIPMLILISFAFTYQFFMFKVSKELTYKKIISIFFLLILSSYIFLFKSYEINFIYDSFDILFFIGSLKTIISPIPFISNYVPYQFLWINSLLNIILLPIMIYGINKVYKEYNNNKFIIFLIFYLIFILLLYGLMGPGYQTPRQKTSIIFIISFFQFYGFISFFKYLKIIKRNERKINS